MAGIDYVIATTRTFTDMDGAGTDYYADPTNPLNSDSLTINSGGDVTDDLTIGGIGSRSITVNAGGKFILSSAAAGGALSLKIADTFAITVNEGGQLFSIGTSGARVSITGSNTATVGHRIYMYYGGNFYGQHTDISTFYYGFETVRGSNIFLTNCTIDDTGQYVFYGGSIGGEITVINSTFTARTASRHIFAAGYSLGNILAINTAFITTTDNFLATCGNMALLTFAGCTYQGAAIDIGDISITTMDIDIRIYEKSACTASGNLAGASVSPKHPSQDTMGFLYDSDRYMKIPATLCVPDVTDATGATYFYGLQKSAYWPSGTAVVDRTWKYWSDSTQAEAGDNQKFTATFSKVGYVTVEDDDWIGNAMTATVSRIQAIPSPTGNPPLTLNSDAACTTRVSTLTVGDIGYINGGVILQSIDSGETRTATTLIQIRKIPTDAVIETLYNAADVLDGDTEYNYKTSSEFGGGTAYNFDTTGYTPGMYYIYVRTTGTDIETGHDYELFLVEAAVIPKAVFDVDYLLYPVDNATGVIPTPTYVQGETLRLAGQVTLTGADTVDNDVDILLYKADSTLVETIPTFQFSSTDGVTQDLDTIFGGIFTKDTSLLDPGDYYYLMEISGSDLEASLEIIATFSIVLAGAVPVISNVVMTSSSITQGQSTKIDFDATNMTATDFGYVEAVGKGVIKKCTTTDNAHYTVTIYGADLPVMTANPLRITIINAGGSDTDDTLTLTVTAAPSAPIAYRLKEAIPIPDEVDLVIKLLENNLLNHRLKHILPLTNILKEQPSQWKEFPGMYIRKVSNVTMVEAQSLGEDYDTGLEKIGSVWQCDIAFDIVAHVKTIFNYPPVVTDGEANSVRYEHAKNCLPVLHTILHTILSENRQYVDPDGSTLQWDSVEPVDYGLVDGGYAGARDVWAIQVLYRFQFEMEVR